jgi:hypothetical protein
MARKHPIVEIEDVTQPFCGVRRKNLVPLIDADPEVADEWCYKKNAGWGPEHFSRASGVRAWWICSYCQREYKAQINNRTTNHSACPYCASKKVCSDNSLASQNPAVAREWHPKLNGKLKASDVTHASNKKAWWLCKECNHEWQAAPTDRTGLGSGCPACYETYLEHARAYPPDRKRGHVVLNKADKNVSRSWYEAGRIGFVSLSKSHPRLAKQWHPTANGSYTPEDFARGSEAMVWWKCKKGLDHEWQSPIYSRTGTGRGKCPFCAGKRVSASNSLAKRFPNIAKEWHATLNGKLTPSEVTAHSGKRAWWQCKKYSDHVWQTKVGTRTKGSGCPYCAGVKASKENNLKSAFPYIAAQLHPTKNGNLKAEDLTPTSQKKVWWFCKKGADHIWQAPVANRTGRGSNCPACAGKQVSTTNSLASLFPEIARQWHPQKNGKVSPAKFKS